MTTLLMDITSLLLFFFTHIYNEPFQPKNIIRRDFSGGLQHINNFVEKRRKSFLISK